MSVEPAVCPQCRAPLEHGAACARCAAAQAISAQPLPPALPVAVAPSTPSGPRRCPYCGNKLMPRETSCPQCKNKVELPPGSAPPKLPRPTRAAPRDDEAPAVASPLRYVGYGLVCHQFRLQATVIGVFVVAAGLAASAFGERAAQVGAVVAIVGLALAGIAATLLGMAGSALCLAAPAEAGTRLWALAALAADIVALPAAVVVLALDLPVPAWGLATLAAWAFLMLFLKRLGSYLDYPDLESESLSLLGWGLFLQLAPVGFFALVALAALTENRLMAAFLIFLGLLSGIALMVASLRFLGHYNRLLERFGEALRGERGAYLFEE